MYALPRVAGEVVRLPAPDWSDWGLEYGFSTAVAGTSAVVKSGAVTRWSGVGS